MATVTAPARRSLIGAAVGAFLRRRDGAARRKLAAAVAIARQHVVTFAALATVDFGAFHGGQVAGWVVTGVSMLVADFAVTG